MADSFDVLFPRKDGVENTPEDVTEPTEVQTEKASEEVIQEEHNEEEVTPAITEPVAPVVEAPKEDRKGHHVPLDVLLEERAKKQESDRKAAELQAEIDRLKAAQTAQTVPDPFDNPDEFRQAILRQAKEEAIAEFRQAQAAQEQAQIRSQWEQAAAQHTETERNEALKFAHDMTLQNTPEQQAWAKSVFSQADPVAAILEQKNRHAQFEEFRRDPDGYVARKAAEMGLAASVEAPVANATTAAKAPPKGIATLGSSSKSNDIPQGDAFDRLFNK